jgi:hypothetical protein
MIKVSPQNFLNFTAKFGPKAEICWKLEELNWIMLNNFKVSSYLLEHILLIWKVMRPAIQYAPNFQYFFLSKETCEEDLFFLESGSDSETWVLTE